MTLIAHIEDTLGDHLLLKKLVNDRHQVMRFKCLSDFLNQAQNFDLIIADLCLPETYGLETVQKVRVQYPDTPILALTGMAGSFMTGEIAKSFMDVGANNLVSKEILTDPYLLELIEDLILPA